MPVSSTFYLFPELVRVTFASTSGGRSKALMILKKIILQNNFAYVKTSVVFLLILPDRNGERLCGTAT